MKIYFINLDRSPERREWYLAQARRLGLDAVRVTAIDAQKLPQSELERWRSLSSGLNSLSAGEIGCFLSHRQVWKKLLESEDEWAFASEDDLHFTKNAARFLADKNWIPSGADVVKAETNLLQELELSYEAFGSPFGHALRRLRSHHFGSGGYFVSRKAAAHLLEFSDRHCEPLDAIIFSPRYGALNELNVLQLSPAICLQDVFVPQHKDTDALASMISTERRDFHRANPQRVRGAAKLWRELKRVLSQGIWTLRKLYLLMTRQSVFQVVPIDRLQSPTSASNAELPQKSG